MVSPADGIVQMITKVKAPEELGLGDKKFTRVSVFMSVFNVHVNRAPAEGKITKAVYVPGKFSMQHWIKPAKITNVSFWQ